MFKSATWRSEKKIKVVFKLQFQATQVPHLKAKTLSISLVPADVGKPTVRLGKSSIHEGTCSWENPIYETVKLVKETKTGKFRGKIYHFIVSTGSSKAGVLGEVSVDFVDFLGATNPVMLSVPLKATNSGAILHVIIQKLEGILDERYTEEDVSPITSYNGGLDMQLQDSDNLENRNVEFTEGEQPNRIKSRQLDQNGSLRDAQFEDNNAYQAYLTTIDKTSEKSSMDAGHVYQTYPDLSLKTTSDESVIDITNSPKEKNARDRMQEASDNVGRLNTQIKMLERQGEVSELELQSLRRQVAKESRKVQELSGQIVALKKERDTLKTEYEQLKSSPKGIVKAEISKDSQVETKNLREIPEEIKQELHHEKHLNKKLKIQLQKTEDSNSELILAIRDLKEEVNCKNQEIAHLSGKIKANQDEPKVLAEACTYKMDQNAELEETVKEQNKADEAELMKREMENLFVEIDLSRKEKEELKMCIEQLTLDYKILEKEKGDIYSDLERKQMAMMEMQHKLSDSLTTQKQLKQEIKDQAFLYSEALITINELKTEVKSLEKKLVEQAKDCQDNLTAASCAKVEQEQRAIRAEEALRKANLSNTKEANHLIEEFRRKSEEMTSIIDENEKLATQAVAESNDLRLHNGVLAKLLQKANDEIQLNKDEYERKLQDLSKGMNLEAERAWLESPNMDVKNAKIKTSKRDENNEAKAKSMEVGRLKQEKHVSTQAAYQKGTKTHNGEQNGKQHGESEMLQKWSEEKEELERELFSVKMEAEKIMEENVTLRTLIDDKKRRDEIMHSEMEKLRIQYDELKKHTFQEMNLENRNLKKHMFQLHGDSLKKQETRPVKDAVMCDKKLEEGKNSGGNRNSGDLGMLAVNTSEIEYCTAESKRDEILSGREPNLDNSHAKHVSDLAKLLNEVSSLKELNKNMAVELKDMQERYSEISLKFAEVEGERQQLVMTLRNLKNGKKT
ncbi:hypothetical protein ACH5RR_017103 [Cinchona calisaya]|uniref:C2 NT-type domain-containing protein n=1 Tax=Cinchona calisaya TaxID=153742 RepID=A0ABD2ZZ04_9GENT